MERKFTTNKAIITSFRFTIFTRNKINSMRNHEGTKL